MRCKSCNLFLIVAVGVASLFAAEIETDDIATNQMKYLTDPEYRAQFDESVATEEFIKPSDRIVNGRQASRGEYPYFCRVLTRVSFSRLTYNCGCSMLTNGWVLTAAHCVVDDSTGQIRSNAYGATVGYYCGLSNNCCDPSVSECPDFDSIQGSNFYTHPNYSPMTTRFDLALIRLSRLPGIPVQTVLPDDGFQRSQLELNEIVTAIGAGIVDNDNNQPLNGLLQEIDMFYVPERSCANAWGFFDFDGSAVCAYVRDGLGGVCFGDSGGPLLRKGAGPQGKDVQIGIHSFIGGTCEQKFRPDVMASVAGGMPWIRETICGSNFGDRPYWCDSPVSSGPQNIATPSPTPPTPQPPVLAPPVPTASPSTYNVVPFPGDACQESPNDEFLHNPILLRTKRCRWLTEKEGRQDLFCSSVLSDAKQICCDTCQAISQVVSSDP